MYIYKWNEWAPQNWPITAISKKTKRGVGGGFIMQKETVKAFFYKTLTKLKEPGLYRYTVISQS